VRDGKDIMIKDFNVSEKGHGSYWPLGILRWVMARKAETMVAQAWWDAASNAATAQQQPVTRQAVPFIRNTNQRYRRLHR
jgi:hypothetical protein